MSSTHHSGHGAGALRTTKAVVLRTVKYLDRSVVLRAYTEAFGLRSYLVRTGAKTTSKLAALQPLSRVELVAPEGDEHGLRTLRELRMERPFTRIQQEPLRGAVLLFAQEVFCRALREESADAQLFAFVQDALEAMDIGPDVAYQPLLLLVGLSQHLGFSPGVPDGQQERFDLREGVFFKGPAPHEQCMEPLQSALFARMIAWAETPEGPFAPGDVPAGSRRRLLDDLLMFYLLHVEGFGALRSVDVLRAVLE